jgi:hypothetical protein
MKRTRASLVAGLLLLLVVVLLAGCDSRRWDVWDPDSRTGPKHNFATEKECRQYLEGPWTPGSSRTRESLGWFCRPQS